MFEQMLGRPIPLLPYSPTPSNSLLLAGDGLGRTLAGAGVGVGALAAHRQRTAMAQAAVRAQIHQPLDVHRHFAAQVALDLVVAVDRLADLQDLGVGQLADAPLGRDADLVHDLLRESRADPVNVLKRDHDALVRRYVDARYTSHVSYLHVSRRTGVVIDPRPVEAGPCGFPCPEKDDQSLRGPIS